MEARGFCAYFAAFQSCALLIAAFALLIGCQKPTDPIESLHAFFEQLAQGKNQEAFASTAFGFQANETEKSFEAIVKDLGLPESQTIQFEPPKIEGNTATIDIKINTHSGKTLPFVITMTKESGAWRVFSIRFPRSPQTGVAENPFSVVGKGASVAKAAPAEPPDDKEIRRLVRQTLLDFDKAVTDRTFKNFYETVSARWKMELTEGQLERAFHPFIEHQYRVSGVAKTEPIFYQAPALDSEGMLVLTGYYPTQPFKTFFSLKFTYELPKWKLFAIDVDLRE